MNEDYENNLYYIEINRYRYQRDDRTGKRRTYTEWKFYINKELKETKIAGQKNNV